MVARLTMQFDHHPSLFNVQGLCKLWVIQLLWIWQQYCRFDMLGSSLDSSESLPSSHFHSLLGRKEVNGLLQRHVILSAMTGGVYVVLFFCRCPGSTPEQQADPAGAINMVSCAIVPHQIGTKCQVASWQSTVGLGRWASGWISFPLE